MKRTPKKRKKNRKHIKRMAKVRKAKKRMAGGLKKKVRNKQKIRLRRIRRGTLK